MGQGFSLLFGEREYKALIVGLDAAGKTTILHGLKLMEPKKNSIPTIGFGVETVQFRNISFTAMDVGGQEKIRPLWRHYYESVQAIVFVVDCNDRERVGIAAEELHRMDQESELQGKPFLIMANKQDLPNVMLAEDLIVRLELNHLSDRAWHVQASSAMTGNGLLEGMGWLLAAMKGELKPLDQEP